MSGSKAHSATGHSSFWNSPTGAKRCRPRSRRARSAATGRPRLLCPGPRRPRRRRPPEGASHGALTYAQSGCELRHQLGLRLAQPPLDAVVGVPWQSQCRCESGLAKTSPSSEVGHGSGPQRRRSEPEDIDVERGGQAVQDCGSGGPLALLIGDQRWAAESNQLTQGVLSEPSGPTKADKGGGIEAGHGLATDSVILSPAAGAVLGSLPKAECRSSPEPGGVSRAVQGRDSRFLRGACSSSTGRGRRSDGGQRERCWPWPSRSHPTCIPGPGRPRRCREDDCRSRRGG